MPLFDYRTSPMKPDPRFPSVLRLLLEHETLARGRNIFIFLPTSVVPIVPTVCCCNPAFSRVPVFPPPPPLLHDPPNVPDPEASATTAPFRGLRLAPNLLCLRLLFFPSILFFFQEYVSTPCCAVHPSFSDPLVFVVRRTDKRIFSELIFPQTVPHYCALHDHVHSRSVVKTRTYFFPLTPLSDTTSRTTVTLKASLLIPATRQY